MVVFYWVMGLLIVGTLVPSVLFFGLYLTTGDDGHGRRAAAFWATTRVFVLLTGNLLIWGHVVWGLWQIWFR